jgi:hypothetical protein
MLSGPLTASGAAYSEIKPEQISNGCRQNVWNIRDWVVALGASEGHEFRGRLFVMQYAAWASVFLHYLAVAQALLSASSESFPGILEERELRVQLAVDENSLTTIDLGRR